jgi:UDP-N-acetylmuramoyl-tripeptide--D-alanyl-D-alanine ligase
MSLEAVAAGLGELRVPKGRCEVKSGVSGITIIDDTHHANRQSMEAALDLLRGAKASKTARRWAVLGDMLGLGQFAADEHRAAGEYAAGTADELVVIGNDAHHLADAAVAAGMASERVHLFAAERGDAEALGRARDAVAALVRANARPGDLVLVKGSQGLEMEGVVSQLMANASLGHARGGRGRAVERAAQATTATLADLNLVRHPQR